jgi:hypothetical protein
MACQFGIECGERPDFGGLHDWIAERFGWPSSAAGWCNIILQECAGDDSKALDSFFALVEDYRLSPDTGDGRLP